MRRSSQRTRVARVAILFVGALALASCAVGAQNQVAEGERLLTENKPKEALAVFREILEDSGTTTLDRQRAALGEARSFLATGDLSGAESRFRRLPEASAAKYYYLGEIAFRRGKRDEASAFFLRALEGAHAGDTAWRLATLTGSEARDPATLVEAAGVARRGPYRSQADALEAIAAIWRKLDGGTTGSRVRAELEDMLEGLDPWPCLGVLKARTLSGTAAEAAWALPEASPEPTAAFRDYVVAVQARGARHDGDSSALEVVIKNATPGAARAIRAEVAASRLWRGDVEGAFSVIGLGPQGPSAKALASIYLEILGRGEEAAARRAKLGDPSQAGGLLGPVLAREGDLLALRPPEAVTLGPWVPFARQHLRRLARASELLREALRLYARGGEPDPHSLSLLAPAEPASGVLAGEDALAAGTTADALARARLARALVRGDLTTASRFAGRIKEPGAWSKLSHGLRTALEAGRSEQARAFLAAAGKKLPGAVLRTIRADETLAEATRPLGGAKGLAAAKEGPSAERPTGSWVDPTSGRRIPFVRAGQQTWVEPGGAETKRSELGGKPRFEGLGGEVALEGDASLPPPRVAREVPPQEVQ
ncbi:MAG: hypothetical protein JKY65_10415 [Planctomycetes bacterium]|nr:hypothetical protein [Planctomycetota bacterium]